MIYQIRITQLQLVSLPKTVPTNDQDDFNTDVFFDNTLVGVHFPLG